MPGRKRLKIEHQHVGPVQKILSSRQIRVTDSALHKIACNLFLEIEKQSPHRDLDARLDMIQTKKFGNEEPIFQEIIEELRNPDSRLRHHFEEELKR